jgi:PAS domain S-box-containing protein
MAIDMTEQALTSAALAESEDRFRASFQQAPLGSAHASLDGVVLRANEPIAELLGVPAQEIVGQRLREWFASTEEHLADSAAVQQLLASQSPRSSAMRTLKNAAGETFPVVVSLSIIRDRHGEVKHLVYTLTPMP